jgi:hypothetical protein
MTFVPMIKGQSGALPYQKKTKSKRKKETEKDPRKGSAGKDEVGKGR